MYSSRKKLRIVFNAPVTLVFVTLCLIVRVIDSRTNLFASRAFCSLYFTSFRDPLLYLRCFTYVLGHGNWTHLFGNMLLILLLGPMVEEHYGRWNTVLVILVTAAVTAVLGLVFAPSAVILGASGIVSAFLLIASLTLREDRTIPVTFILLALLYAPLILIAIFSFGTEIYDAVTVKDNVFQLGHVGGGVIGAALGFLLSRKKKKDHF